MQSFFVNIGQINRVYVKKLAKNTKKSQKNI